MNNKHFNKREGIDGIDNADITTISIRTIWSMSLT